MSKPVPQSWRTFIDGEKATVYFANQEDMSVFTDLLREALGDDGTKVPHG
jgi:hypothetical protein